MTSTPDPAPDLPVSPGGLPRLVDQLEERAAAEVGGEHTQDEVARDAGHTGDAERHDPEQDQTATVPGAPEPPD